MSKVYAVKVGQVPGIYHSWPECQAQVLGFPGALYKSFPDELSALAYLGSNEPDIPVEKTSTSGPKLTSLPGYANNFSAEGSKHLTAYTDGSLNPATDVVSSAALIFEPESTEPDHYLTYQTTLAAVHDERNIGGEVQAVIGAMNWAIAHGFTSMDVYYDYYGVEMWATHQWKAKKFCSKWYQMQFDALSQDLDVKFHKVKGHTGVQFNELVDQVAKAACGVAYKANLDKSAFVPMEKML